MCRPETKVIVLMHLSITSLSLPACEQAATELATRRRQKSSAGRLPETCRPQDLHSAWTIQKLVSAHLAEDIGGWKCGMPGADKFVLAPIYANTLFHETENCTVVPLQGKARIEPELAYMLREDLPLRDIPYTPDDVDAAIGETRLALELIASRYSIPAASEAASFYEHLADGLFNQGLYLGPVLPADTGEPSALSISIDSEGDERRHFEGQHPAGNPRAPLYWLVEFLRQNGIPLCAGQAIITGSYAGSPDVALDKLTQIHFAGLGSIRTRFHAL